MLQKREKSLHERYVLDPFQRTIKILPALTESQPQSLKKKFIKILDCNFFFLFFFLLLPTTKKCLRCLSIMWKDLIDDIIEIVDFICFEYIIFLAVKLLTSATAFICGSICEMWMWLKKRMLSGCT